MKDVVIVDTIRTPIGRYGGGLKDVRSDDLGAIVIAELLKRNPIDAAEIEDVIFGCANQAGEDNRNVARMSLLLAGLPITVAGTTINRLCASSMDAVAHAARAIQTGAGDIYIAGGVESMTRAPFVMAKADQAFSRDAQIFDTTLGWRFTNKKLAQMHHPYSMGETAENVAEKYKIDRKRQDEFAVSSQQKYGQAHAAGIFKEEIVRVSIPQKKGDPKIVDTDEHPRPETTMADLERLKPAFREGGTVTAGNASGVNDGACALLLMSEEKARALGLKPIARFVAAAVAGVDPACMGIGPVPATRKVLQRTGLKLENIDIFELNEAFAAQVLACTDELGINLSKVNVNGGAIALGHPLGMSGSRLIGTLAREMQRRSLRYGLATMCIGVGQGMATVLELV
ncbi:MAG: 3-oxoadipyl-CoA thiolase [Candidatus Obscuribacterales bacterium]|jgi:3-oxoadipyl-CoA thiolase|nr:3-oxoadipyl-CoA thiolase [Candidatus Obscuribacterales bacterium]